MKKQPKPASCGQCKHAVQTDTALICYRFPPAVAVIDNKPMTMRVAVQPSDQACGEYRA